MAEEKKHQQTIVIAVDGSKEADKALHCKSETFVNSTLCIKCIDRVEMSLSNQFKIEEVGIGEFPCIYHVTLSVPFSLLFSLSRVI